MKNYFKLSSLIIFWITFVLVILMMGNFPFHFINESKLHHCSVLPFIIITLSIILIVIERKRIHHDFNLYFIALLIVLLSIVAFACNYNNLIFNNINGQLPIEIHINSEYEMNLIFELISLSLFLFSYVQFFAKDIANSKSYVISLYVIILLILIGVLYSLFTESYQIFNDESFNGFESLYGSSDLYGYSLLIGICFLCLLNQQNKTIFNHISALIFLISLLLSKSPISTLMGIIIYIIYYFLFFKDSANKTIKNYKIICISLIILIISLNIIVVLSELSLLGNFGVHISEIISFNLSYFGLLWARFTDAVSTMFVLLSNRVNMAIGFGYKIGDLILYRTSVRPFSFVFTLAMNCGLAGLLAYLIIFAFFVYASIKTIIKMKQNGIYVSIFICSILFLTSVVDNSISIFYMILLILVLLPNIVKFQNCSYNLEAEKKK